jgi:hypothetical protein
LKSVVVLSLVVALIAPVSSGCSFVAVSRPPPNHRQLATFDCGGSILPPAADTALTGGGVLVTAIGMGLCDLSEDGKVTGCRERMALVAVPLFVALPLASAIYGYSAGRECREAKAELMARSYGAPPAPAVE